MPSMQNDALPDEPVHLVGVAGEQVLAAIGGE